MTKLNWLLLLVLTGLLAVVGCKKSDDSAQQSANVINIQKLREAFPNPDQDLTVSLNNIGFGIRYGDYMKALVELDKLANSPSLNEQQKKVVNDTIEAVKKKAAEAPPPAQ